ncbi:hypothetical protein EDB19DRAFT_1831125 [Suillus lakei]|nr:hypothetical protein EDB19DRAFT_1831125 [Suillus lakei]
MAFNLIKHIFNFFYPPGIGNENYPVQPPGIGDLIHCYDRSASVQPTRPSHALDYIMWSKKNLLDSVGACSIPYCGDISSRKYTKIAYWFSENIPGASDQVEKWLGGMPLASDSKNRVEARNEEWSDSELLKMAWADLIISYPADSFVADIDLECLTSLEANMFEDFEEAGPAGNQQWGLDAGQHHWR